MKHTINAAILISAVSISLLGFNASTKTKLGTIKTGTNIGEKAPELNFKNPAGKEISLAKVNKDKYVLVDFWASWCRPCRGENRHVVASYTKFKDKKFTNNAGFTIYSVSLDASLESWKAAILQDGLIWENHVSDLKQWQSEAGKIYGIEGIPTNFLLNPEGIIIAKDLRGVDLSSALEKLVKK